MRDVPEALRAEMVADLPAHPCDLLRTAIVDELFGFQPFQGVLGDLKAQTASTFDEVVKDRAALADPAEIALPNACDTLGVQRLASEHASVSILNIAFKAGLRA